MKVGHMAKSCKSYVKCTICQKRHVTLTCPELELNKRRADDETKPKEVEPVHSHLNCTNEVLLLEKTARKLGAKSDSEVELRHLLFGGHKRRSQIYGIWMQSELMIQLSTSLVDSENAK